MFKSAFKYIIPKLICLFCIIVIAYVMGLEDGKLNIQEQAVENKLGYWIKHDTDAKYGKFHWYTKDQLKPILIGEE